MTSRLTLAAFSLEPQEPQEPLEGIWPKLEAGICSILEADKVQNSVSRADYMELHA